MSHHRSDRRLWDSEWTQGHAAALSSAFASDAKPSVVLGEVRRIAKSAAKPARVYFKSPSGVWWRVYDVVFGPPDAPPFHEIAYAPPRVNARARVFIARDGERRSFSLDSRHGPASARTLVLDAQTLTDQFLWSGYPAGTQAEEDDPRRNLRVLPIRRGASPDHGIRIHTSTLNRWTAFEDD